LTSARRRLVVDSSVVLKWVLPEPGRNYAVDLLNEYEGGLTDLIAPALLMEEAASGLSKRCRRRELTPAQASKAYQFLELRQPLLFSEPVQLRAALELSILHHLSFWDSVYLALAIDERCDLVTADRRLQAGARRHYPFVILLGDDQPRLT
jgi:predicted nucleic acid-binding protein